MSCISELIEKQKTNSPLYLNERVAFESGGHYKDFDYCVTFNAMGNRCGYVAIPPSHPLYSLDNINDAENLVVHGGITLIAKSSNFTGQILPNHTCTDKWLGFDAGHCDDKMDIQSIKQFFPESEWVNLAEHLNRSRYAAVTKDNAFMVTQCKQLIDQLPSYE